MGGQGKGGGGRRDAVGRGHYTLMLYREGKEGGKRQKSKIRNEGGGHYDQPSEIKKDCKTIYEAINQQLRQPA